MSVSWKIVIDGDIFAKLVSRDKKLKLPEPLTGHVNGKVKHHLSLQPPNLPLYLGKLTDHQNTNIRLVFGECSRAPVPNLGY